MIKINSKQYDVRTGDVFVSNKTGAKLFIDCVSRIGVVFYHNEAGETSMLIIEKLFEYCKKA